jgi:pentalenene oxygenase
MEFQFSRLDNLLRDHAIRTVTVDGTSAEFVTDPALVHHILIKDSKNYGRGDLFQKARYLSRTGLLAEEESLHRHYRRLAHPHLRAAAVADHAPAMRDIAHKAVTAWRPGQPVNIQAEMCRISSSIALTTLLPGLSPELTDALVDRLAALSWEMIRNPLHGKAAARAERQGSAQRLARTRENFRTLLATCLPDQPHPEAGYVPALLADTEPDGTRFLTEDQICDEAIMLLTAATVTTASVLSWSLYELSREPLIEEKVLKDLAQQDSSTGPTPGRGRGHGPFGYTTRFLLEILRLYPPVWITSRRALSTVHLGDRTLPAGTHVLFSSYHLHRNPDRYPDPHRLDPDRWLSIRPAADDASYIPFGTGAKGCIGESFAWQELGIVLDAVTQEWQLSVPPGSRIRKAAATTLHPRRLIMIPQPR